MQQVEKIIHGRWIIPIVPQNTILQNHALIIDQHKIIDILPSSDALIKYQSNTIERFNDHAIMPGLINAHTHLAMNFFRGLADDLPLERWLNDYIWPSESATLSSEMVLDGTKHALSECIRTGVTCVNDHYFYPQSVIEAIDQAGIRARVANCIFNFPLPWVKNIETYFNDTLTTINSTKNHPRIYPAIGPHAPYTVDDQVMAKVTKLAQKHQVPVHIHLHESSQEVSNYIKVHGKTAIQHFSEQGWLNAYTIAVHMTQISDDELITIANNNVNIVHCPESNMKLSSGMFPWKRLKDNGINIALGTDGAASNNDLDMFGEMKSAAFLAKLQFGAENVHDFEILEMATINGAKALHLDEKIGSLETGKQADFIAIDLNQPETQPVYNPISQIVYAASRAQVTDVWCAGKRLLKNRELLTINKAENDQNQYKWAQKVRQALSGD
ncbi:TRZ/ATZ family hydrolase [Facilibium subflavum]|uniref:TRZ/ATZ family hydrolase n=1 Tax=Facilibium subflavum TaxID=2219058 RepID=UPI000E652E0F|nr:TRZ/ATZ family hydrolase [Facilibium subflavum]